MAAISAAYEAAKLAAIADCLIANGFTVNDEVMLGFQEQADSAGELGQYLELVKSGSKAPGAEDSGSSARAQWQKPEFRKIAMSCNQEADKEQNPAALIDEQMSFIAESFSQRLMANERYAAARDAGLMCVQEAGYGADPSGGINDIIQRGADIYASYQDGAIGQSQAEQMLASLHAETIDRQAVLERCFSDLRAAEFAMLSEIQLSWLNDNPGVVQGFIEKLRTQVEALDAYFSEA